MSINSDFVSQFVDGLMTGNNAVLDRLVDRNPHEALENAKAIYRMNPGLTVQFLANPRVARRLVSNNHNVDMGRPLKKFASGLHNAAHRTAILSAYKEATNPIHAL